MKIVQVTAICGGPHEERTLATVEHIVALDMGKPTVVDMCADCEETVLSVLQRFLDDGEPMKGKGPNQHHQGGKGKVGNLVCEYPLGGGKVCQFRTYSEQGLQRHRTVQGHEEGRPDG